LILAFNISLSNLGCFNSSSREAMVRIRLQRYEILVIYTTIIEKMRFVRCDALTGRIIILCYLWVMPTAMCALTGRAAAR
jgi:hypothetical protein